MENSFYINSIVIEHVSSSHLHIAVRRCAAQHLSDVVEFMEPERVLSGTKDMADRVLPAAAKFAQDSSPETR